MTVQATTMITQAYTSLVASTTTSIPSASPIAILPSFLGAVEDLVADIMAGLGWTMICILGFLLFPASGLLVVGLAVGINSYTSGVSFEDEFRTPRPLTLQIGLPFAIGNLLSIGVYSFYSPDALFAQRFWTCLPISTLMSSGATIFVATSVNLIERWMHDRKVKAGRSHNQEELAERQTNDEVTEVAQWSLGELFNIWMRNRKLKASQTQVQEELTERQNSKRTAEAAHWTLRDLFDGFMGIIKGQASQSQDQEEPTERHNNEQIANAADWMLGDPESYIKDDKAKDEDSEGDSEETEQMYTHIVRH